MRWLCLVVLVLAGCEDAPDVVDLGVDRGGNLNGDVVITVNEDLGR